jgi:hypothetical protein
MSISSVAIIVGSLSLLAKMAARAISKESCDSTDAYRKLLRMGSCAASFAASFLCRDWLVMYVAHGVRLTVAT